MVLVFFCRLYSENTLRKNQQRCEAASSDAEPERPGGSEDACGKPREVGVDSQRLSKLASAFEESLRVSRDEKWTRVDACEKSVDSVAPGAGSGPEARDGESPAPPRYSAEDDDDDDDCRNLLASLTDLQTQLQQEIRQTRCRLGDRTSRGVAELSAESRTSVHDSQPSTLEDTTTCETVDDHLSAATTTATAAESLPTPTTTVTGYCRSLQLVGWLVGWRCSSVIRTLSLAGGLSLTCALYDLWLTGDHFVRKRSAIDQPTRPTQPSYPSEVGK